MTSTKRERFREGRSSVSAAASSAVAPARRGRPNLEPPSAAEKDALRASLHLPKAPVGDEGPGHAPSAPKRAKLHSEDRTGKESRLARLKRETEELQLELATGIKDEDDGAAALEVFQAQNKDFADETSKFPRIVDDSPDKPSLKQELMADVMIEIDSD